MWLVACSSLAGGAAYAWSGRRWWRIYQGDPAAHGRAALSEHVAALRELIASIP